MTSKIQLFRPNVDVEDVREIQAVLESGWLGAGPKTQFVEQEWPCIVGAKFGIATNSCTSALNIALRLAGVGPGMSVLVPTITFAATAEAVRAVGATPILCDVCPETLLIDLVDAERRRRPDTVAIIPVLYAGQVIDLGSEWNGMKVIYDCAHAGGTTFDASDKVCCWSFQAVKNLGIGDGGMVTMGDELDHKRGKSLAWHGITRSTWDRSTGKQYQWDYDIAENGIKGQMNDIAAAILTVQMRKRQKAQQHRRMIAYRYTERLNGIVPIAANVKNDGWHLFVVKHPARDQLADFLAEKNIVTGVHYKPLHLHTAFKDDESRPVAEREWRQILSLPIHTELTFDQVDLICELIDIFCHDYKEKQCAQQTAESNYVQLQMEKSNSLV